MCALTAVGLNARRGTYGGSGVSDSAAAAAQERTRVTTG